MHWIHSCIFARPYIILKIIFILWYDVLLTRYVFLACWLRMCVVVESSLLLLRNTFGGRQVGEYYRNKKTFSVLLFSFRFSMLYRSSCTRQTISSLAMVAYACVWNWSYWCSVCYTTEERLDRCHSVVCLLSRSNVMDGSRCVGHRSTHRREYATHMIRIIYVERLYSFAFPLFPVLTKNIKRGNV